MGEPADMRGGNPEELAVNRDLAERIFHLAENLPEKQRIVFTLRDLHDQTIEEVATIVGISQEAVRTNLCYARAAIRTKLEGTRKE
jgi:RNA polymerase sigma-70 factor (ECF subfamily)